MERCAFTGGWVGLYASAESGKVSFGSRRLAMEVWLGETLHGMTGHCRCVLDEQRLCVTASSSTQISALHPSRQGLSNSTAEWSGGHDDRQRPTLAWNTKTEAHRYSD